MPQIEVQLRICVNIADDKKVTLGNLASAIKGQKIEAKALEEIVHALDVDLLERYCGKRYGRGNGDKRYQRGGTSRKKPVTAVGKIDLKLHKVVDTGKGRRKGAGGWINTVFRPVEDIILFDGKKIYQEDISMIGVEWATKMTYRDTKKEAGLVLHDFPSARTVNSRVIEYGEKMKVFHEKRTKDASLDMAFADGTKTHTQDRDRYKNEINVVLGKKDGKKVLLDLKVNRPWEASSKDLEENGVLDEKATIVADAERGIKNALVNGKKRFQLDLVHTFREVSRKLWEDGEMSLDDRKAIVRKVEGILYPLKNSVETHLKDGDTEALRKRVNSTVNELKKISRELSKLSCGKAAKFIRDYSNFMVTFARLAVEEGKEVPWNSNIIERLMGEISKRCKHKWMRWTTRGIGAILWIILVRYTNEKDYEIFKDEMMSSENLKYITCEAVTISAGGVI